MVLYVGDLSLTTEKAGNLLRVGWEPGAASTGTERRSVCFSIRTSRRLGDALEPHQCAPPEGRRQSRRTPCFPLPPPAALGRGRAKLPAEPQNSTQPSLGWA